MATIIKRGEHAYMARIRKMDSNPGVHAYRQLNKTFRTPQEAEAWAKNIETSISEGSYDNAPVNLGFLAKYYLELRRLEMDPHQFSIRCQQVTWWVQFLKPTSVLTKLKRNHLLQGVDKLKTLPNGRGGHKSTATVNRYIASISSLLSKAVDMGWLDSNPCTKLQESETNTHVRYLSASEKTRLLDMCQRSQAKQLYPLVFMALTTGGRVSELTNLTWSDIDFRNKLVHFKDTKNGLSRSIAIGRKMERILLEFKVSTEATDPYDYIFKSSHNTQDSRIFKPRVSFEHAVKAAKVPNFTFHDLRHTFASYMAQSGATLLEIKEALGHQKLNMVLRYTHLSPSHNDAVVRKMLDTVDL